MRTAEILIMGLLIMLSTITLPTKANSGKTTKKQGTAVPLTVQVTDIDISRGGTILIFVFGPDGYPKQHDKALHTQARTADTPNMEFLFNIEEDTVAIKVLHDEDENGKVTKNWTGIFPKEGLGFSNNQKIGLSGVPGFKKSAVTMAPPHNNHTVSVRYPGGRKRK